MFWLRSFFCITDKNSVNKLNLLVSCWIVSKHKYTWTSLAEEETDLIPGGAVGLLRIENHGLENLKTVQTCTCLILLFLVCDRTYNWFFATFVLQNITDIWHPWLQHTFIPQWKPQAPWKEKIITVDLHFLWTLEWHRLKLQAIITSTLYGLCC